MLKGSAVASLSDAALLDHLGALVAREQQTTAELVASLGELDTRRLYLDAGCSSLFTYCTQVLHLSEYAAYTRIEAARCARKFPEILERLADGTLTLTAVSLLAPVMTFRNARGLMNRARHKSKRDVERLVAEVRPQPSVATVVRKTPLPKAADQDTAAIEGLPGLSPSTSAALTPAPAAPAAPAPASAPPPASVRPLAPDTYKVQFTLSGRGHEQLRRAQDLLRHSIPNGDVAAIFERALSLLVRDLEKKKLGDVSQPRASQPVTKHSRHIPAALRREVWRRDGGQCAFAGTQNRCRERGFLEFHHVIPFADGGTTSTANLELRCRAHNQHEAKLWTGVDLSQLGPDRVGTKAAPGRLDSPSGREPP